jgi:hypothetical protein
MSLDCAPLVLDFDGNPPVEELGDPFALDVRQRGSDLCS